MTPGPSWAAFRNKLKKCVQGIFDEWFASATSTAMQVAFQASGTFDLCRWALMWQLLVVGSWPLCMNDSENKATRIPVG